MDIAHQDDEVAALQRSMLNRQLFAIRWTRGVSTVEIRPHLADHLRWMIDEERKGTIFASGPLTGGDGVVAGDGLTIARAATIDEARALAARDPLVLAGARGFEVWAWRVMEGRIGLTVRLSDGGYAFE